MASFWIAPSTAAVSGVTAAAPEFAGADGSEFRDRSDSGGE